MHLQWDRCKIRHPCWDLPAPAACRCSMYVELMNVDGFPLSSLDSALFLSVVKTTAPAWKGSLAS